MKFKFLPIVLCSFMFCPQALGLQIILNDTGGAAPGTEPGDAFAVAASFWEDQFSDPIDVYIDVGFSTLGSGILGQAQSFTTPTSYTDIRSALFSDIQTDTDSTVFNHLPVSQFLSFLTNEPDGSLIIDDNQSVNNSTLKVNNANLKALGLLSNAQTDAAITFSDQFAYDFNPDDGVSSTLFDFVGIAIHEIGHALGFVSGVDFIDFYSANGPGSGVVSTFDFWDIFSVLDLFRFSQRSLSFGESTRDLAIFDASQYFSIDDGLTAIAPFSSGRYNGDGHQASHWENITDIGIMKPTISRGQVGEFTLNDLLAFDAIGFDPIFQEGPEEPPNPEPEPVPIPLPPSTSLFLLGLLWLTMRSPLKACRHQKTNQLPRSFHGV